MVTERIVILSLSISNQILRYYLENAPFLYSSQSVLLNHVTYVVEIVPLNTVTR